MVVEPRVKDFICTTAHPVGCAANVKNQIEYVKSKGKAEGPKKVLVIGASTGYGLASRISVAYGYGADTLGVMFEKESNGRRTASAGFYNTRAFEEQAHKDDHQRVYGIHLSPAGRIQNDRRLEQIRRGSKDSLQIGKMQSLYRLSVE